MTLPAKVVDSFTSYKNDPDSQKDDSAICMVDYANYRNCYGKL
jgi:hypothetical protein